MGLIPHVSFYISNLLLRVLNYGWNLPDMALSYISLPPSSHLDPSSFIILCEDHLVVSKPCPTTWKSALIFISEGFWRAEILGGGMAELLGRKQEKGHERTCLCAWEKDIQCICRWEHTCVLHVQVIQARANGSLRWKGLRHTGRRSHLFLALLFYLIFYYFFRGWGRKIMLCVLSPG